MEILILLGIGVIVSILAIGITIWIAIKSIKLLRIRIKKVNQQIKEFEAEERATKKKTKKSTAAKGYVKNGTLYSPTGWKWDDEAKLWVPPEK